MQRQAEQTGSSVEEKQHKKNSNIQNESTQPIKNYSFNKDKLPASADDITKRTWNGLY